MNFPIKGDIKFLRNLKKGDILYINEASWDADNNDFKVTVKSIEFDYYSDKKVASNEGDAILAVLCKGEISAGEHNICYGFFQTPMLALRAFKEFTSSMDKAASRAINKENKRLEKLLDPKVKASKMKAKSSKVELFDKDGNKIEFNKSEVKND